MKKWKPEFYIVYPRTMIYKIEWPDGAPYRCCANLAEMLQFVLNTESIGSEIKLIWNYNHRKIIMDKNNVTSEDIDNYVKASSSILSFMSKKIRDRVKKKLVDLGGNDFIYVDSYRDVILQQAYYYKNKQFKNMEE